MSLPFQSYIIVVSRENSQKELVLQWLQTQVQSFETAEYIFINEERESSISIDTVREVQAGVAYSVAHHTKRFIVFLYSDTLTLAAQNAALKLIEEPPTDTYILLITSTPSSLLPTIQSRCQVVHIGSKQRGVEPEYIDLYYSLKTHSHGDIITLSEKYSTKQDALSFVSNMAQQLYLLISEYKNNNKSGLKYIINYQNISKSVLILLETQNYLQKNSNVKLALSECLFKIKKLMHKP